MKHWQWNLRFEAICKSMYLIHLEFNLYLFFALNLDIVFCFEFLVLVEGNEE